MWKGFERGGKRKESVTESFFFFWPFKWSVYSNPAHTKEMARLHAPARIRVSKMTRAYTRQ